MSLIEFNNVKKKFAHNKAKSTSLKEAAINWILRRKYDVSVRKEFLVLDNVSFNIECGQTVGILGENGTGKSTILKLIAKIYSPNDGEVIVNGTVSSLLEIGAGFQPDLTGQENVFLYGAILGLPKWKIEEKYNDIIEFAELQNFMQVPVKHYSSGMYMRLAFAVAVHVDPDIILLDEVLAVGDEAFQKKCFMKIKEFQKRGKTIVFVSHDMNSVRQICDRAIFLRRDGSIEIGIPDKMINLYLAHLYSQGQPKLQTQVVHQQSNEESRWGNQDLEITAVELLNEATSKPQQLFFTNDDMLIRVHFRRNRPVEKAVLGFAVYNDDGTHLSGPNCFLDGKVIMPLNTDNVVQFSIRSLPFLKGRYLLTIALYDENCQVPFDHREKRYTFQMLNSTSQQYGLINLNCEWHF